MNSSERRLKLILLLQSKNKNLNARQLAEHFDVSRRTIFRDLNVLGKMDIPITWDKYSGYGIMPGYKIPPIMFNPREIATIMVGLSFAKSQVDQQLAEDAGSVELKIKNVLPAELKQFMDSIESRTIVDPYMHFSYSKKKGGNWYTINSAIAQSKSITFAYTTNDNRRGTRKLDPYILVFYRDHWNTIGYSHKRNAIRNFVLDKMADIQILEEHFTLENDIDPKALIFRSGSSSYTIIVDVNKSILEPFKANLPANIINYYEFSPNFFRFKFVFDNISFINRWLLQFGNDIKIISPDILKDKRKALLKSMLK